MRKLPNGDALHHIKDTGVSTSFGKAKEPSRESSESAYTNRYYAWGEIGTPGKEVHVARSRFTFRRCEMLNSRRNHRESRVENHRNHERKKRLHSELIN